MRINHPEWYPCYLNPDFGEIVELAKSGWDTCRILVNPENNDFIIASGYGNTHSSIVERYRVHLQKKRAPQTDAYILFHEQGVALFNLEEYGSSFRSRFNTWSTYFGNDHLQILRDLIRESELAL